MTTSDFSTTPSKVNPEVYSRDGISVSFFESDNPDYPFAVTTMNYQEFETAEKRQAYADWWIDVVLRQRSKEANEQARRSPSAQTVSRIIADQMRDENAIVNSRLEVK